MAARINNRQFDVPDCFINGLNTSPIQVTLPEKQVFFGVQLQPLAVKKMLGIPAGEFADRLVDLALIDRSYHSLWHQLADLDNFDKRVGIFFESIESKLGEWLPQEDMINNFLSDVDQHDLSVSKLASSLCYSPRHLSRKMQEATGMNTEEILRFKKYLHALHLIHHTNLSLTKISYLSSFSDQSHFIKTFKIYAGMTPREYRQTETRVKGHFYKDVR